MSIIKIIQNYHNIHVSVKLEKSLPDESIIDLNTVNLPHLVFFIIITFV